MVSCGYLMAQKIPVVLVMDVYATASIAGSIMICLCWRFGPVDLAPIIGALVVIILRVLAVLGLKLAALPTGKVN